MIVATAKIAGAREFYSHDRKCRTLANLAGMVGKELPQNHPDMFKDKDFRREFGLNH